MISVTVDGFRVFDNHLHVQPLEYATDEIHDHLDPEGSAEAFFQELVEDPRNLLQHMDEEGIDRAGLITYVAPEGFGYPRELNDWVAGYTREHRDRLTPIGSIHPGHVGDAWAEMERLIDDLGLRAFKYHPPHQGVNPLEFKAGTATGRNLRTWFEVLEARDLPLIVHTGTSIFPPALSRLGNPMLLDDVAVAFPDLTLILAHSGRPLWTEEAFFLARRHRNVWLDLSGIPPQRIPHYLPRLPEVADRTLWGSDWPGPGVRSMRANVEAFLALELLTDDQKQAILWGNNVEVLG